MTAREYDQEGRLPRFSLDRRITVLVIFLTLLVVGAVATQRIPVELFPQGYDDPFLLVHVPWDNAPPRRRWRRSACRWRKSSAPFVA